MRMILLVIPLILFIYFHLSNWRGEEDGVGGFHKSPTHLLVFPFFRLEGFCPLPIFQVERVREVGQGASINHLLAF